MKLDVTQFSTTEITSTSTTNKMKLAEGSEGIIFQMFTKNIYSNPIGSVVREITSNCFDSHVEAGVKHPVLIKKSYDESTNTFYISFVDYGMGISPERMGDIYSTYFASTKRETNEQIGAFGLGSKTPLAYKRITGEGEGDYDNSFSVITIYNGTKYYYNIYEGKESPEWTPFFEEPTQERNGTEIRIPVLQKDMYKFEDELVRQLYYFENVVFEGFSDKVQNDYQIIRGKNFLYRGDGLDSKIHVCLGKVYYPINYDVLNLNSSDYEIPIAINVPIGKVNVTVSREQLDYSESTIKYLQKRLVEVKDELKEMLSKQYDNVVTLEDAFKAKNNFGKLYLTDDKILNLSRLVRNVKLNLTKYRYNDIKVTSSSELFGLFFDCSRFGKKEGNSYRSSDTYESFNKNYDDLISVDNVYYVKEKDYQRKRLKQGYLRSEHGRFYIVQQRNLAHLKHSVMRTLDMHFDDEEKYLKSKTYKLLVRMQKEYFKLITKHGNDYVKVEVPEEFKLTFNRPKLSSEFLKTTVPVKIEGSYSKKRVKIEHFLKFKGVIYYTTADNRSEAQRAYNVFTDLFDSSKVATEYSTYYHDNGFPTKKGLMFISMAAGNVKKYIKHFPKVEPVENFFTKMMPRKIDEFVKQYRVADIVSKYKDIDDFYKSKLFLSISETWKEKIEKIQLFIAGQGTINNNMVKYSDYYQKYISDDLLKATPEEEEISKLIEEFEVLEEANSYVIEYLNLPTHWSVVDKETDARLVPMILKKVLSL